MKSKNNISSEKARDNRNNQAISLKEIRKHNPFSTPKDYFEDLPAKIQSRISAREKTQNIKLWQYVLKTNYVIVSSIIVTLVIAFILIWQFRNANQAVDSWNSLTFEDIYEAKEYLLAEIDESGLMTAFLEINEEYAEESVLNGVEYTDDQLIEYLLQENNIEYYLLNEY